MPVHGAQTEGAGDPVSVLGADGEGPGRFGKASCRRKLKDRHKIERRLGSIQARHPQVADLYQMEVVEQQDGLRLEWQPIAQRQSWQQAREGAYLLRTNLPDTDPNNSGRAISN